MNAHTNINTFFLILAGFIIIVALVSGYQFETYVDNDNRRLSTPPMKTQTYDIINVSPAMAFKERNSKELQEVFDNTLSIPTFSIDEGTVISILKMQLGSEYEVKSWQDFEKHYEVIVQSPSKMYGIDIIIPKDHVWHPKVRGFIFDDLLNVFPSNKSV